MTTTESELSAGFSGYKQAALSAGLSIKNGERGKKGHGNLLEYKGEIVAKNFFESECDDDGDVQAFEDVTLLLRGSEVFGSAEAIEIGADRPGVSYRGSKFLELGTLEGETFKPHETFSISSSDIFKIAGKDFFPSPEDVVRAGVPAFEEKYNAGDFAFCGSCFSDACNVTVDGGTDAGGVGPLTSPTEVAAFLKALRDDKGAKDMKITVTEVSGSFTHSWMRHKETWTSATFTGACETEWVLVGGAPLGWKMQEWLLTLTLAP